MIPIAAGTSTSIDVRPHPHLLAIERHRERVDRRSPRRAQLGVVVFLQLREVLGEQRSRGE
jgi:hypothetical protein